MSRLKMNRSVRISDRLALAGAALLLSGALLSSPSWQPNSWQIASSGPVPTPPEGVTVSQGRDGVDAAIGRQRFTISQFLFRRR